MHRDQCESHTRLCAFAFRYKCNIADNLSLPRDIIEIRGFAAGSLIVDTLIAIQMPSEERAMVLAKKLKAKVVVLFIL